MGYLPLIPEPGDMLLFSDELASPADFMIYANIAAHLKDPTRSTRCVLLAVSESLTRLKSMTTKSVSLLSVDLQALLFSL